MNFLEICEAVYRKYNHLKESKTSSVIKHIQAALIEYIESGNFDNLKDVLVKLARYSSNASVGLISDTPEIIPLGQKITNSKQVYNLITYACETLDKKYLERARKILKYNF